MITSLSWLKNHLITNANLNQIAERLTEIGLEVENIQSSNSNLDNFTICKIIKSQKHPNANKLKLCEVDIGKGNLVKVLTGKDKNKSGEIIEIASRLNRAKVKGINIVKKHLKATKEKKGGIISKENFIHLSNLRLEENKKDKTKTKKGIDKK